MTEVVYNGFVVTMIILIIILIAIKFIRLSRDNTEGFTQQSTFISKSGDDIYDTFYSTIYDSLNDSRENATFEYSKIVELTRSTPSKSMILDVGSGTGHLVDKFSRNGYPVHGIDKSIAMVEESSSRFPEIDVKYGDVMDSIMYDRGTFTHITCMNRTIYHIEDKSKFLRNCYNWLIPHGFLIIHLVDIEHIDRDNKSIDFHGFKYEKHYSHDGKNLIEKFTDDFTQNVRQNDFILYMESIQSIVRLATTNGFIAHAQVNFRGIDNEYIYVFERIL